MLKYGLKIAVVIPVLIILSILILNMMLWFASLFGYIPIGIMLSNSMSPTISKGDIMLFGEAGKLNVNDIVSYRNSEIRGGNDFVSSINTGTRTVHRIVEINDTMAKTRGDSKYSLYEEEISIYDINEKVVFNIPLVGWPYIWMKCSSEPAATYCKSSYSYTFDYTKNNLVLSNTNDSFLFSIGFAVPANEDYVYIMFSPSLPNEPIITCEVEADDAYISILDLSNKGFTLNIFTNSTWHAPAKDTIIHCLYVVPLKEVKNNVSTMSTK